MSNGSDGNGGKWKQAAESTAALVATRILLPAAGTLLIAISGVALTLILGSINDLKTSANVSNIALWNKLGLVNDSIGQINGLVLTLGTKLDNEQMNRANNVNDLKINSTDHERRLRILEHVPN